MEAAGLPPGQVDVQASEGRVEAAERQFDGIKITPGLIKAGGFVIFYFFFLIMTTTKMVTITAARKMPIFIQLTLEVTKIAVGPSAPPITPMEAASLLQPDRQKREINVKIDVISFCMSLQPVIQ